MHNQAEDQGIQGKVGRIIGDEHAFTALNLNDADRFQYGYENGFYISPTIIEASNHNNSIVQEEIFRPVLSVVRFSDVEEAIELANSTDYGLVAGVWTKDIDIAHYVASRIESGQVFINSYGAAGGVQMPFGGYKKSGIGREKSHLAVQNYIQIKNLAIQVRL